MANKVSVLNKTTLLRRLKKGLIIMLVPLVVYGGVKGFQKLLIQRNFYHIINTANNGNLDDARNLLEGYSINLSEKQKDKISLEFRKIEQGEGLDSLINSCEYEGAKQYFNNLDSALFSKEELNELEKLVEDISPAVVWENTIQKEGEEKISALLGLRTEYQTNAQLVKKIDKEVVETFSHAISEEIGSENQNLEEIIGLFDRFNHYLRDAQKEALEVNLSNISCIDKAFSYLYLERVPSILRNGNAVVSYIALGYLNGKTKSDYFFEVDIEEIPIGTKGRTSGSSNKNGNIEVKFDNGVTQWMKVTELKKIDNSYEELGNLSYEVVNANRQLHLLILNNNDFIEHCFKRVSANEKNSIDFLEYLFRLPSENRTEEFLQRLISETRLLAHQFYEKKQDLKTAYYLLSKAESLESNKK